MKKKEPTVHTRCTAKALRRLRGALRSVNAGRRRAKLPTMTLVDVVSRGLARQARYLERVAVLESPATWGLVRRG